MVRVYNQVRLCSQACSCSVHESASVLQRALHMDGCGSYVGVLVVGDAVGSGAVGATVGPLTGCPVGTAVEVGGTVVGS